MMNDIGTWISKTAASLYDKAFGPKSILDKDTADLKGQALLAKMVLNLKTEANQLVPKGLASRAKLLDPLKNEIAPQNLVAVVGAVESSRKELFNRAPEDRGLQIVNEDIQRVNAVANKLHEQVDLGDQVKVLIHFCKTKVPGFEAFLSDLESIDLVKAQADNALGWDDYDDSMDPLASMPEDVTPQQYAYNQMLKNIEGMDFANLNPAEVRNVVLYACELCRKGLTNLTDPLKGAIEGLEARARNL